MATTLTGQLLLLYYRLLRHKRQHEHTQISAVITVRPSLTRVRNFY